MSGTARWNEPYVNQVTKFEHVNPRPRLPAGRNGRPSGHRAATLIRRVSSGQLVRHFVFGSTVEIG
jgi:hypothetical protein